MSPYKTLNALEVRTAECARLVARFPGMVPVVAQRAAGGKAFFTAVPHTATVAELEAAVRDVAELGAKAPLALLVADTTPVATAIVGDLFLQCKADDGLFYVTFTDTTVGFGCVAIAQGPR